MRGDLMQACGITHEHLEAFRRLKEQGRVNSLVKQAAQEGLQIVSGVYVAQPAHIRLRFPLEPTRKAQRPACGAKCRDGHACKAKVVPGKTKCRLHGGLSTGAKTEAGRAAIVESNKRRAKQTGM